MKKERKKERKGEKCVSFLSTFLLTSLSSRSPAPNPAQQPLTINVHVERMHDNVLGFLADLDRNVDSASDVEMLNAGREEDVVRLAPGEAKARW